MIGKSGSNSRQYADRQHKLFVFAEGLELNRVNIGADQGKKLLSVSRFRFLLRKTSVGINAHTQGSDRTGDVDIIAFALGGGQTRQFNTALIVKLNIRRSACARQLETICAESIGFDHVCAGGDIRFVDGEHEIRVFDIHGIEASISARMGFMMQHRTHRAVSQDRPAAPQSFTK